MLGALEPSAPAVELGYDLAGNVTFAPFEINIADDCSSGHPVCGSGQEYDYDQENRVVAIYRDTNDQPGPLDSQTGASTEPKVYEFAYDALGRRVLTTEYLCSMPALGCTRVPP